MAAHADRYMVSQWRPNGRVIRRTTFKTRAGAHAAAARLSNDSLLLHTMVHSPEDERGRRADLALFRHGKLQRPPKTERNTNDPRIQRMLAYYTDHHTDQETTDMSNDPGTTVEKPKFERRQAKSATATPKRKNPITVEALLALSDTQITALGVERRPDLPAEAKIPVSTYALVYARFLTGQRKVYPNPWMSQTSAEDGRKARQAVRKAIGKAAGVKVANADGAAPRKPKAEKPAPAAPPVEQPKARRRRAVAVSAKPKPAAKPAAKRVARKPASKK